MLVEIDWAILTVVALKKVIPLEYKTIEFDVAVDVAVLYKVALPESVAKNRLVWLLLSFPEEEDDDDEYIICLFVSAPIVIHKS